MFLGVVDHAGFHTHTPVCEGQRGDSGAPGAQGPVWDSRPSPPTREPARPQGSGRGVNSHALTLHSRGNHQQESAVPLTLRTVRGFPKHTLIFFP